MMPKKLLISLKLLLGAALFALLFAQVDVKETLTAIVTVDPLWLVVGFALPHLGIAISAFKWKILLSDLGIRVKLVTATNLYMIGTFFSNFLPSVVGGDVIRALILSRETSDRTGIAAATFAERFIGFVALVTLIPISFFEPRVTGPFGVAILLTFSAALFAFLVSYALYRRTHRSDATGSIASNQGIVKKAQTFARTSVTRLGHHRPRTVFLALVSSYAFYGTAMLTVFAVGLALGISIQAWTLLVAVPLVLFLGLLPISLNGLGVAEIGWVVVLGLCGVASEDGLALALLLRIRQFLTAVVGGVSYLSIKTKADQSSVNRA